MGSNGKGAPGSRPDARRCHVVVEVRYDTIGGGEATTQILAAYTDELEAKSRVFSETMAHRSDPDVAFYKVGVELFGGEP